MKRVLYKEAAEWYYSLRQLRISMLFLVENNKYMTKKEKNAERSFGEDQRECSRPSREISPEFLSFWDSGEALG